MFNNKSQPTIILTLAKHIQDTAKLLAQTTAARRKY